jgi:hypothetical protein
VVQLVQTYLKSSCAKLLAAKFNLNTQAKVYQKFGSNMRVTDAKNKTHIFIPAKYGITLKYLIPSGKTNQVTDGNIDTKPIIPLYASKSIATFDNLACEACGSNYRVEMHHVRALKDLNPKLSFIDKLMVRANRKQIPLCRKCHMTYHRKRL